MRAYYIFLILFTIQNSILSQKISWANQILHTTVKFESKENNVNHMLGMPSIYQGVMNGNIDPFSEGYILYNSKTSKKNVITLGFEAPLIAEQLVIGGVMNMGTIKSIYVINTKGKKQEIYQMMKGSISKFHNFNVYFEPREVNAVEITIDHQKVNNWNIIKGIGLVNSNVLLDLQPDIFTEDEFYGKEEFILYNNHKEKCISFNPKLSHDEKKLYYVKECDNQEHQDIWMSEMTDGGFWTEGIKLPFPINNDAHNFVASVGTNGKFLLLGNAYNPDGTSAGDGVSITHKQLDGSWGTPKTISIPGLVNENDHTNFFMTSDENAILMAIQDSNSIGDLDLYVSIKNKLNATWSKPINLGRGLNTEITEDYPFLSNDGKTLYFSSNGYIGFGGHDVYMTQRLDDTWQNWTKPLNLGPLVNSKVDDCGFSLSASGKHGFYHTPSVKNDTIKKMDLFRVNIPKFLQQETNAVISGTVKSKVDSLKYPGSVKIYNVKGEIVASNEIHPHDEFYTIVVPVGKIYKMSVELENHIKRDILLDFADSTESLKMSEHFKLIPLPDSGRVVKFPNINFDSKTFAVVSIEGIDIDSLSKIINTQKNCKVEIQVLETGNSNPNINNKNSLEKAKSIREYLSKKGVNKDNIQIQSLNVKTSNQMNVKTNIKDNKSQCFLVFKTKLPKVDITNQYIRN